MMRPIPPDIWTLAVTLGKTQSIFDETKNAHVHKACEGIAAMIDRYLEAVRGKRER